MKKFSFLVITLLLLLMTLYNPTDELFLSFKLLTQGSALDVYTMEKFLIPYNFMFNLGLSILFIAPICSRISEIFELRNYLITRGGEAVFKKVLIKKAFAVIVRVLLAKLLLYGVVFLIEQSATWFILYDLVSTLLTLGMFAIVFILCKLNGASDKMPLFLLISGNMIAQILSFEIRATSIIVIASIHWEDAPFGVITIKALILLLLIFLVYFRKNANQILEVENQ